MRKLIVFIAILLFLFISCKEKEDSFLKEFQSGNYDNVLFLADSKLKDRLSDDALFYKAASYYHEGDYPGASDCAYLYLLIYNDDSAYYFDAADVLIRTSDDFSRILFAGEILYENGRLGRADYLNYYLAMINDGYEENARNFSQCDSLLIGDRCGAHTFPVIQSSCPNAIVEHEATTSKISEDQLFYARQRGISEEDAVGLIVNGYAKEVLAKLPMEFAMEAQKLLSVSLEGSVG